MKRAIISSLHSDSIRYVGQMSPETVISFDAHPDLGYWKNAAVVKSILELKIAEKVKSGLFRASIQALLRVSLPQTRIFSVVPEACVISDFNSSLFYSSLTSGSAKSSTFSKRSVISLWQQKLAILRIEGYKIPPGSIESLFPVAKGKPLVFDIDVDYLFELTRECQNPAWFSDDFVPIDGTPKENLGSVSDILKIIRIAKPDLVTLSEVTYKCLNSRNKDWRDFLRQLKRLGYDNEEGIVYTDTESKLVLRVMADFHEFYTHRANCEGPGDFLNAHLEFFDNQGLTGKTDAKDTRRKMPPFLSSSR